ncbi:TMV resistance protein N-like [Dorcoceras hygrometricum]|uniref:TMV resistance protein N-like n=1 Tax=Dorcoceras hygrometricum TaxID=472368 RepID=A0A2Z7C6G3_9LAMI|nr:TMV resistance protein N-like [Dorcoceras hygrometricum]
MEPALDTPHDNAQQDLTGNPGFTAGRGFNPAGGAPGGVDWAVKMRIRPPEFETSICDVKYHVSLASGLGETPMHVGVDASLSRIHRSQKCVDILCYLRG